MITTAIALATSLLCNPMSNSDLHDPFGVAWGFLYGYSGVPSPDFMPELRSIGGRWTKIYLIWNQIEPKRGEYDWHALDKFLGQIQSPEEALISVFSVSTWATRTKAVILPPSPAIDQADYDHFIRELVRHCKGRVRYFQNDSEPNNPVYWSGTASEFAAATRVFSNAVRSTDHRAKVILGGYDGLFNPGPGFKFPTQEASLKFFRDVLTEAPDTFDFFDLRLYADPSTIPARVDYIRKMISVHGKSAPIICTEYNGPGFFDFGQNLRYVPLVTKWSAAVANQASNLGEGGVSELYKDVNSLAPQTQMFLMGADPGLDAKLRRIQCRDLVQRNVLALSAGVQRTLFWDLWHDTSKRDDLMTLMYGKLKMFDYADGQFGNRYPVADAFARMCSALQGVKSVKHLMSSSPPSVMVFDADCGGRGHVLVLWRKENSFSEAPADTKVEIAWDFPRAVALDALGDRTPISIVDGKVTIGIGPTPVFVSRG